MGEGVKFNLTFDKKDEKEPGSFVDTSERLREIVAENKGKGRNNPAYVKKLLDEVSKLDYLIPQGPAMKNIIESDGFVFNKAKVVAGKLFISGRSFVDKSYVLLDAEGKRLNKENSILPFETVGLHDFHVCYSVVAGGKSGSYLIDENGDKILPEVKSDERYRFLDFLKDENGVIKYVFKNDVQPNGGGYAGEVLELDGQLASSTVDMVKEAKLVDGVLAYHGVWGELWVARLGNSQVTADVKYYKFGLPFYYQSQPVVCRSFFNPDNNATGIALVNMRSEKVLSDNIALQLPKITEIRKTVVYGDKIYIWAGAGADGRGDQPMIYCYDGSNISKLDFECSESSIDYFDVVAGKLVVVQQDWFGPDRDTAKVSIGGKSRMAARNFIGDECIYSVDNPITVLGATGQIFYLTNNESKNTLWVDNEPRLLPDGEVSFFLTLNNHVIWGETLNGEKDCYLYVDGVRTQYFCDDIKSVVFQDGKYLMLGKRNGYFGTFSAGG